jgi:hypothetical protein
VTAFFEQATIKDRDRERSMIFLTILKVLSFEFNDYTKAL